MFFGKMCLFFGCSYLKAFIEEWKGSGVVRKENLVENTSASSRNISWTIESRKGAFLLGRVWLTLYKASSATR
jgi:hypothetical protein